MQRQKEQQELGEQTLVININLTRGLVALLTLALLTGVLLVYLGLVHEPAAASDLQATYESPSGLRKFYLTDADYDGDNADGASVCTEGYHFASLWESLDVSNLEYDQDLSTTNDDSGYGPPSSIGGWIRTGYSANNDGNPGKANCTNWGTTLRDGTTAKLVPNWVVSSIQDIHVWDVENYPCSSDQYVWCVED
jgi:hypothetical protein